MRLLRSAAIAAIPLLVSASARAQSCGTRAVVESIPAGNSGALGALALAADGMPLVGQPFDVRVANGPPNAHGCIAFSFTQSPLPLPQYQSVFYPAAPTIVNYQLDPSGEIHGLLGLTSIAPSLCGVEFFAQSIAVDPTAPGGLGVSNALRIVVGDSSAPRFVYVHSTDSMITANLIDETGTPIGLHAGSPFSTGGVSGNLAGDDNRRSMVEVNGILYTANTQSHDVSALRIEPDGSLTPIPGSPFPSGSRLAFPRSLAVHPSGRFLYVAHDSLGTIGILAIEPNGPLSQAFPPVTVGRHGMVNIAMHPSGQVMWASWRVLDPGRFLFLPMRAFGIASNGSVTDLGDFGPLRPYANVIAAPSGAHFYAATALGGLPGSTMGIFGFEVNLTPTPNFPVIGGSPFPNTSEVARVVRDLVASVTGNHVYVLNSANPANPSSFEHIHVFSVESNGALTSVNIAPTPPGTESPSVLAVSEDGTRLYAAGFNKLTGFAIDGNGAVTHLGTAVRSGRGRALGMVIVQ